MSEPRGLQLAGESGAARFREALELAEGVAPTLESVEIPDALGRLERLRAILDSTRLQYALQPSRDAQQDRLLRVSEAADKLGCSASWLYREAARLPFTIRNGRKLMFSANGIAQFIRRGGIA